MICTIATLPYLSQALVLATSFHKYHPQEKVYLLLVGDVATPLPKLPEYIEIYRASDLGLEDYAGMETRYTVFELCNALKPFWLEFLIQKYQFQKLCYFDADVCFFHSIEPVLWNLLDSASVVLTPHFCCLPDAGSDIFREIAVLRRGVYNGGFIGVSNTPDGLAFLQWWKERLGKFGYHRLSEGMNCDQLWLDFAPSFGLNVRVFNHPGCNVAYWNLHERQIRAAASVKWNPESGIWLVNGQPLIFFHFSGYSTDFPDRITLHWTAHTFSKFPELKPLFQEYRQQLAAFEPKFPKKSSRQSIRPFQPQLTTRPEHPVVPHRVSVVVTALDNAGRIQNTIQSILAQTTADIEIIVVESGLVEDLGIVLEPFGHRIRHLRLPQMGLAAARHWGLLEATGEFIAFLDAGDWLLSPTRLSDQMTTLCDNSDLCLVNSGWQVENQHGKIIAEVKAWKLAPDSNLSHYLLHYPVKAGTVLFRRSWLEQVGGFDTSLEHTEVEDLISRLALAGGQGGWVPYVATRIRTYQPSTAMSVYEHSAELEKVLNRLFSDPNLPPAVRQNETLIRFETFLSLSVLFFKLRHLQAFFKYLHLSLATWPGTRPEMTMRIVSRVLRFYWGKV